MHTSTAEQWYFTCQFKAFVDMQYFLKQFCCLSLIKLHIVQGVNNVQKCLITAFSSLTTKLGRCHPNVCTAETGSQLLTATSYRIVSLLPLYNIASWCVEEVCRTVREPNCSRTFRKELEFAKFDFFPEFANCLWSLFTYNPAAQQALTWSDLLVSEANFANFFPNYSRTSSRTVRLGSNSNC
jgi:hypothetical protein